MLSTLVYQGFEFTLKSQEKPPLISSFPELRDIKFRAPVNLWKMMDRIEKDRQHA